MRPLVLSALVAVPALLHTQRVQAPSAPWMTVTTAHYRIHFPAGGGFPAFAAEVVPRIEDIHNQYLGQVGHAWSGPIDVLLEDPVMEPNGMAFPFAERPFVVLWRTPPDADSPIGHHRGWAELLLTHELGHMHHLLIPQRGRSFTDWLLGLRTPVAMKSPRWVAEGYATLLEGRLTGSGRPHSAFRAAVLRTWAREGRLPAYEALDGSKGFLGGNMAYLVGSAYLTWLEQQHPDRPTILQDLWRHLSGPAHRDFTAAFVATFGHTPQTGYARFCAEVTHGALELERRLKAQGLREGEVYTKVDGWVSDLALNSNGTRLLARVGDPRNPTLRVWDLTKAPKPQPKASTAPGEPQDAPLAVPVVKATWTLPRIHGAAPRKPVWAADGRTVVFRLHRPETEGLQDWTWLPGHTPRLARARLELAPTYEPFAFWDAESDVWNLRRSTDGFTYTPLTRTLTAAWSPAPSSDGKNVYYASLTATGVEIRKLDLTLPPLVAADLPLEGQAYAPGTVVSPRDQASALPNPWRTPPFQDKPLGENIQAFTTGGVGPIPFHDYRVGETLHAFTAFGGSATPSQSGFQMGLGFNDILGRLNGQVLVGEGHGATVRGAMAGAAWRGSAWEPSLHLFSTRQRLSLQKDAPVFGFDRERQGASFELRHEDLGITVFQEHLRLSTERQTPLDGGDGLSRTLGEVGLRVATRRSLGDWGFQASLQARMFAGNTGEHRWQGHRGGFSLQFLNPLTPLTARYEAGRLQGHPTAPDRFTLGGIISNLLPEAVEVNQVSQVALPGFLASGDRFRRWRGEVKAPVGHAYVEHLAVWQATSSRPAYLRIAGWEVGSADLGLHPDVIQRLVGRLSFSAGIHRVLDGPTKNHTVGTLTLSLRP